MQETMKALTEASHAVFEWLNASGKVSAFILNKMGFPGTAGGLKPPLIIWVTAFAVQGAL